MSSGVRRLPAQVEDEEEEDDELRLLEVQLSVAGRFGGGSGCSGGKERCFHTYPRRRSRPAPLMAAHCGRELLDEVQSEQTRGLLANIHNWNFNAFALDRLSDGRNLTTLCAHLFESHGLLRRFELDAATVWKFFSMVEGGYRSCNPYHNNVHAADVTQAMACFLAEPMLRKHLGPVDVMGALIAAVCHDLDHPGLNEKFLVATSSHLAGLYGASSSVLENHHWRFAVSTMWESGFARLLSERDRADVEDIVRSLILATDISKQQEFLGTMRRYQETGEIDLSQRKYRHFVLQMALKCADISNPCRVWNISRLWSHRACEEFFRQGDRERELGMPVTPLYDRSTASVAKVQSGFYRFIAGPLFEQWHKFIASPLSSTMVSTLAANQARWDALCSRENRPAMAESVASHASSSSTSSSSSTNRTGPSRSKSNQDHHRPTNQRWSRSSAEGDDEEGGEDSDDPCASYPYMPLEAAAAVRAVSRRHSIPIADSLSRLLAVPVATFELRKRRRRSLLHQTLDVGKWTVAAAAGGSRRMLRKQTAAESFSSVDESSGDDEDGRASNVTFRLTRCSESSGASDNFDLDIAQCNLNVVHMQQSLNKTANLNENGGGGGGEGGRFNNDRRRGSAPCNLLLLLNNRINSAKASSCFLRRGSLPADHGNANLLRRSTDCRRGSVPLDLLPDSTTVLGRLQQARSTEALVIRPSFLAAT